MLVGLFGSSFVCSTKSPLGKYPSTLGAGYHGDFPEYFCLWTVTNVAYIELMLNFIVFSI